MVIKNNQIQEFRAIQFVTAKDRKKDVLVEKSVYFKYVDQNNNVQPMLSSAMKYGKYHISILDIEARKRLIAQINT